MNPMIYSRQGHTTRLIYIIESSLDNCIGAVVAGVFLTMLLKRIGISDSLTGIISNLSTLACTVQMFAFAVAQRRRSVKKFIVTAYTLYHLLFLTLYLLPFLHLSKQTQIVLFIFCFLGGSILNSIIYPNKFNWLMSYVPDTQHGSYTANREIVVLITGMIFNYGLSAWVDDLNAAGHENTSLILCGITIAIFSVLHILTLTRAGDAPANACAKSLPFSDILKSSLSNAKFRKLLPVAIVYTGAVCFSTVFYTVYQMQELHFSLKFIALLTIIGAVARAIVSRPLGRFADTRGWAKALTLAFAMYCAAFLVNSFTVPSNGKVLFVVYTVLVSCGAAITCTGIHTIVFSYIPPEIRTASLGIYSAAGGVFGFLASLLGGLVVAAVQNGNNLVFGRHFYAQQVVTFISFLIMAALLVYMQTVVCKMKTLKQEEALSTTVQNNQS